MDIHDDDIEPEAGDYETYCANCAGVVALDAERCPHCLTVDFDPADAGE